MSIKTKKKHLRGSNYSIGCGVLCNRHCADLCQHHTKTQLVPGTRSHSRRLVEKAVMALLHCGMALEYGTLLSYFNGNVGEHAS